MKHFLIIVFAFALSSRLSAQHFVLHAVLENAINLDTVAVNSNYVDSTVNAAIMNYDYSAEIGDSLDVIRMLLSGITGENIYSHDGTLTGNRNVTLLNHSLNFNGGNVGIGLNGSSTNYKLEVRTASDRSVGIDGESIRFTRNAANYIFANQPNSVLFLGAGEDFSTDMRILANGNVGIGPINPNDKLEVTGPVRFGVSSTVGGRMFAQTYTANDVINVMSSTRGNGALAIGYGVEQSGVTAGQWNSTQDLFASHKAAIQLGVSGKLEFFNTGVSANNPTGSAVSMLSRFRIGSDGSINQGAYGLENFGAPTSVATGFDVATGLMTDDNNVYYKAGNVGIGTTIPAAKLHVNGVVRFEALPTTGTVSKVLVCEADGDVFGVDATTLEDGFEANTDNQTIDKLELDGSTLKMSLSGDNVADEEVNLSTLGNNIIHGYGRLNQTLSLSSEHTVTHSQLASSGSHPNLTVGSNTFTCNGNGFLTINAHVSALSKVAGGDILLMWIKDNSDNQNSNKATLGLPQNQRGLLSVDWGGACIAGKSFTIRIDSGSGSYDQYAGNFTYTFQ